MNTVAFDELAAKPDQILEKIYQMSEPFLLVRENSRNLVIFSQKEYDSVMETFYLLKSPKNALRLLESLKHAREGKVFERQLTEE